MKKRGISVHALVIALAVPAVLLAAAAALLFLLLHSFGFHPIHSLADITDEDLRGGSSSYRQTFWMGHTLPGGYAAQWHSMTGWDTLGTLSLPEGGTCTLRYTVEDPGTGYRLVLSDPEGGLTDLEPGDNILTLPAGETRVVLAAYETSGAFSLELLPGSPADPDFQVDD